MKTQVIRAMFCAAAFALMSTFSFAAGAETPDDGARPVPAGVDIAAVQKAAERGLAFIHSQQNKDGSWGSGSYSRDVGITALAAMAMMSQGNVPGSGKYGDDVQKGVLFILRNVNDNTGFIGTGPNSRMYSHGFAALCLAEAYGMMQNESLPDKLKKAIRLIIRAQKPDGGWRYDPLPTGQSDLSVTVCQVMALRAARNAGIKIPKNVIDQAITYVKKSANADGSFRYMLSEGSGKSYALTAAGITTLFGAGEYDSDELKKGLEYLKQAGANDFSHYFYGHYYAAQAMYLAGGQYWDDWFLKMTTELLRKQQADGSWTGEIGEVYCTAMACIVLQIHNCYLPIFQR